MNKSAQSTAAGHRSSTLSASGVASPRLTQAGWAILLCCSLPFVASRTAAAQATTETIVATDVDSVPVEAATLAATATATAPLPRWAFFSAAGAAGAALLTTVALGLSANGAQRDFNRLNRSSTVVRGAELLATMQRSRDLARAANVATAITVTLVAASATSFFFTDLPPHTFLAPLVVTVDGELGAGLHLGLVY